MKAWVWCPSCSPDYPKQFDKQVRLEKPGATHGAVKRRCPGCEKVVRLSIGSPVLPTSISRESSMLDGQTVQEFRTESTLVTGDWQRNWCVYVLECGWSRADKYAEGWAHTAEKAHKRVYVGSTDDLERRLHEHAAYGRGRLEQVHEGSQFTRLFEPETLMEVHLVPTKAGARELEKRRSYELSEEHPEWFVYQA